MSRRGVLFGLVTLLVTVSLSGCLGGDDKPVDAAKGGSAATTDGNNTAPGGTGGAGTGGSGSGSGSGSGAAGSDAAADAPIASFTISGNGTGMVDTPIDFDASASSDPKGTSLTYNWDFGDNGTAEGVLVNHTFAAPGNFTVVLTVTNTAGLASTDTQVLPVEGAAALEPATFFSEGKTIVVPNPAIAALGTAGTVTLADYQTRGGASGTTWQVHTVTGFPAGVESLRFQAIFTSTDNTVTNFVIKVFPEDGSAQIKGSTFPAGKPDVTITAEEHGITETTYKVFVYMAAGANQAYTLEASYA